ncbi:glycosyltransferase family 2 protein [Vibrio variabilis]|uniref:glycosyltransferase family 2 protein n=1 Tax=Vibrio variabilis TaxID=990271 RepID=UPI00068B81C0|nr:glycosyltransferase family 2 protein [Vibrio variabilis]
MIELPLVSVVVASYRRVAELERALISLSRQDYTNLEVVVVDDNAEELWNEKVKGICDKYLNVTYIRNNINLGSAKSRNVGIVASQGKYITFLDDDDEYLRSKISVQVQKMENEKSDYSITNLELYNSDGKLVDRRIHDYIKSFKKRELVKNHILYHLTGTDTFMFRTDYLNKIGNFPDLDVGDEYYLMMRAIEFGGKFTYINECHVKAYVHFGGDAGLSSGYGKIKGEKELFLNKKQKFSYLSKPEIRYVTMRHYAVLAYTYYRMGKYRSSAFKLMLSFSSSPLGFVRLILRNRK